MFLKKVDFFLLDFDPDDLAEGNVLPKEEHWIFIMIVTRIAGMQAIGHRVTTLLDERPSQLQAQFRVLLFICPAKFIVS
jgi:hypothetical protein